MVEELSVVVTGPVSVPLVLLVEGTSVVVDVRVDVVSIVVVESVLVDSGPVSVPLVDVSLLYE